MKTILYTSESNQMSMFVMNTCLRYKISFEFLNGNEFFFTIYDDEDLHTKRSLLGYNVIDENNIIK